MGGSETRFFLIERSAEYATVLAGRREDPVFRDSRGASGEDA